MAISHMRSLLAAAISTDPLRETRLAGRAPGFFANCATYGSRMQPIRELLLTLVSWLHILARLESSSSTQFFGSFLTELPLTGIRATLIVWFMTLLIQRAEHRDTQALQAKMDELLHAHGRADNAMTRIDEKEPEEMERYRDQTRASD